MGYATYIKRRLWETRHGPLEEAVFVLHGPQAHSFGAGTVSTLNLNDLFRSKGYLEGREYTWDGPYVLRINNDAIDRDVLDHLELQGAEQQPTPSDE